MHFASAYCPQSSSVLESRSHLLHKSFGLHPSARPKAQTLVKVTFHPTDVSIFSEESLLHFCLFLFTCAVLLPNNHSSLSLCSPAVLAFSDVQITTAQGGLNTYVSWPNDYFCFLGNPLSLHISFKSPTATSTSCILLTATLQLRNSTNPKTFQIDKTFNTVHFAATFSSICAVLFLSVAEDHFLFCVHIHIALFTNTLQHVDLALQHFVLHVYLHFHIAL